MNERKLNIFIGLFFVVLLIGMGILQTHLKSKPQILMLIFGLITLISFILKLPKTSTWLFYILIGTMLFVSYFTLVDKIIDFLNPNRGWVEYQGERYRVMDMNWIWGVFFGFILSPLTIILYHKKKLRNRSLEIGLLTFFLVITSVIYIVNELL